MYFIEQTRDKFHTAHFVPESKINNYTGFRSMFKYHNTAMKQATEARTVKVLAESELISCDTVFVDFDDNQPNANKFEKWLKEESFVFERWDSGGRSDHFHIPILPLFGSSCPKQIKKFMASFKLDGLDLSFYHYAGLFRLPGTEHHRTGKQKILVEQFDGDCLLQIPELITETKKPTVFGKFDGDLDYLSFALIQITNYIGVSPKTGNRNSVLFEIASHLRDAGLERDTAFDLLVKMDETWLDQSKGEEEVERVLNGMWR